MLIPEVCERSPVSVLIVVFLCSIYRVNYFVDFEFLVKLSRKVFHVYMHVNWLKLKLSVFFYYCQNYPYNTFYNLNYNFGFVWVLIFLKIMVSVFNFWRVRLSTRSSLFIKRDSCIGTDSLQFGFSSCLNFLCSTTQWINKYK